MTELGRWELTSGPVGKTLIRMAMLTLAASLLQSLQGSVNAIWISRLIGPEGLAASYTINILLFFISSFVFGFGVAATVEIGRALGQEDIDRAREVFGTTFGVFAIVGTALVILVWFQTPAIIELLGVPEKVTPMAIAYARAALISTPAAFLILLIMMCLRGFGDALTPMWVMAGLVIGDGVLNPVFILGFGPIQPMGISGSGAATVVSTYLVLAVTMVYAYLCDLPLRLRGRELRYLVPSLAITRKIVTKGGPVGLQMVIASSASLLMTTLVNNGGEATLTAFGAVSQIWTYVQMPGNAVGVAVSVIVSQNIGAERWDRVGKFTRGGIVAGVGATTVLVIASVLGMPLWITIFFPAKTAAGSLAAHINLVVCWSFMLLAATTVLTAVLRANRVVIAPLAITFISLYPVRLGFAALLEPRWGTDALWWSFPVSVSMGLALTVAYYVYTNWRECKIKPESFRGKR